LTIYLLAGLGFDKRAFQNLQIADAVISHLDWMEPLPYEKIEAYAARMIETQIAAEHRAQEIIFIGHSFGGVLSQEMALQLPKTKLVILISSIKSHREKPFWMRYFYWLPVYWLIAKWMIRLTAPIWSPWYGYKTKTARKLLVDMAMRFSNRYHRWATRTIAWWRAKSKAELESKTLRVVSIHGTKDLMFPFKNIAPIKYPVEGGNHFMCYHEATEVSKLIKQELDKHQVSET
jgi:pimeloyl-ACP methyl ester carboxylesterase